jgi:hypothetical protein
MATKTISLELDAYEYLQQQKRGGESFSAVVRRAYFENELADPSLVNDATASYLAHSAGRGRRMHQRLPVDQRRSDAIESFDEASLRQELRNRQWPTGLLPEQRGWSRAELYQRSESAS